MATSPIQVSISYPIGSFVRHIKRPDQPYWVVIASTGGCHMLRSTLDGFGHYEVINGDGFNLEPVVVAIQNAGKYSAHELLW